LDLLPAPAKEAPKHLTNSIGMEMVLIPKGTFLMGSKATEVGRFDNEHQHEVEITKAFYLSKYEVTKGEFAEFVRATGHQTEAEKDGQGGWGYNASTKSWEGRKPHYTWRSTGWEQTDRHPVVNVTWNDAVAFCKWLSEKEGKKYRLPTEAEWEYGCRAWSQTRYHNGDNEEGLAQVGNVADASFRRKLPKFTWGIKADDGYAFTAPVGKFKANAFGLHDMHGNAWEWCQDWYDANYYRNSPRQDPQGPADLGAGAFRVLRGGAWFNQPRDCRSAFRAARTPSYRVSDVGFRVVCVR
jgi:formylglycine-generating enzyme required for sulfatase activity